MVTRKERNQTLTYICKHPSKLQNGTFNYRVGAVRYELPTEETHTVKTRV